MLHAHRAERADALVDGLAGVLLDRPADPFAPEIVAVPAKGVERWITQRLSHVLGAGPGGADGICANVRFPHPSALVGDVVAASAGVAREDDPWQGGRAVWALLDVIDACVGEPWCATLAGHLGALDGDPHRRGRRFAAAARLARLLASYAAARPAMLRAWAAGDDSDGAGRALDADLAWQAELWRRLRARIGAPSPAERLPDACARLRAEPGVVDLPARVSLFGPTRLTTAELDVVAALAAGRDVHLWLPHPSPALWDRLAAADLPAGPIRRRADPTTVAPRNPLLASLGRDARELQLRLAGSGAPVGDAPAARVERPATLLGAVQAAVATDQPPGGERPVLAPSDRSLQVHACHGPARQVEVLREVLLGLLADDESLEPRDILVMCPDIEAYAPLISATFGLADDDGGHPGHRLRVRLADRSLRQTNPLLDTLAALLDLATARVTASEVLDLAGSPPVRRRFQFSDDDLERLQDWAASAGVRWGLDAAHRAPYGLAGTGQNTWRAGLDRLLLGAAMDEDGLRSVGLALPLDDVDSNEIDLAGQLAELVDRLAAALDAMTGERPLAEWLTTLTSAIDGLTAVSDADAWQAAQCRRELARLASDAAERGATALLSIADVRAMLADRLKGRPTRANFRTGTLTMCSMVPMRSVPHRVVCLLGLDDGRFPRTAAVDGDDVLARDPLIGERDARSEDRQLLLDAVLAARETLVVLHTGADPRTNAPRPPAVPVGEILDAANAAMRTADGRPVRAHVVVHHPLQPFDVRNFVAGELGGPAPFSFDTRALRGSVRSTQPRERPLPFLGAPLPRRPADSDVALEDLAQFLEHPTRALLKQRLELALLHDEPEPSDALTVDLTGLAKWAVGGRVLAARLAGVEPERCVAAERRRGELPPGELGKRVLDEVGEVVEPLVAAASAIRVGEGRAVDVAVDLGRCRLSGTVPTVHGETVVRVEYSRLSAKHRLRAWAQVLALSAAYPDVAWTATTIGRAPRGNGVQRSVIGPVPPGVAIARLAELVALRERGLAAPLPLVAKTSAAYAEKRHAGMSAANAVERARVEWDGGRYDGENADEAHRVVWGELAPMSALLAEPAPPDERTDEWPDDASRFAALARRLWEPLLGAETLDTP